MESSTCITFTTTQEATLTLVFNSTFTGKVKINGTNYNPVAGVLTVTIPSGSNTILKGDSANLFYMSVAYSKNATAINSSVASNPIVYPNPVIDNLSISSTNKVERVDIYNTTGILVKSETSDNIDMSNIKSGCYILMIQTQQGLTKQTIIKK